MATRTKPLMKAAALMSAAAVAVATPALAPSITAATPPALSSAKVELATFSDLLSITPADWNNALFTGWGGAIGPINVDPQTELPDYWLPQCNYDCTIPGISGVTYLALDALINGNGQGINDAPNWAVSAVNYFYEGSFSTGLQYIVQKPFVTEGSPLYNPAIANLIALAFQGPYALTTIYVTALSTVAELAANVPFIGEYLYRGIGSYIGPAFQTVDSVYDYSSYAGWSGVLRYIGGVITTGGNPNPYPLVQSSSAASTAALAAKVPTALSVAGAPAAETAAAAVSTTPAATVADTKVTAVSTEASSTPAEAASPTATTASSTTSETKPADTASTTASSAVADTPAATAPATKPAAAPAPSRKRPLRAAAAGVAKAATSAVSGAASAATGTAASAGGASAAN